MINIKKLDRNKIKIDEDLYKNIFIYHIGYVTIKKLTYKKINSVNPLSVTINKINQYVKKFNGNKYLTLVSTNERKYTLTD